MACRMTWGWCCKPPICCAMKQHPPGADRRRKRKNCLTGQGQRDEPAQPGFYTAGLQSGNTHRAGPPQMPASPFSCQSSYTRLHTLTRYSITWPPAARGAGHRWVIRQVVESAGAGIFVQPGDAQEMAQAILSMALEPQKAHQMGLAGRSYVEKTFQPGRVG